MVRDEFGRSGTIEVEIPDRSAWYVVGSPQVVQPRFDTTLSVSYERGAFITYSVSDDAPVLQSRVFVNDQTDSDKGRVWLKTIKIL